MKKLLPTFAVGSILLAAFPAVLAQDKKAQEGTQALEERVLQLESALSDLKKRNDESEKRLEQVVAYLEKQARAGEQLLASLEESERLGFTAGINFRSREVLLAAFRAYWGEEQADVPRSRVVKNEAPAAKGQ